MRAPYCFVPLYAFGIVMRYRLRRVGQSRRRATGVPLYGLRHRRRGLSSAAGRARTTTPPINSKRERPSKSIATIRAAGTPSARRRTAFPGYPADTCAGRQQPGHRDRRARRLARGQPAERRPRHHPGPPAQGRNGRGARTARPRERRRHAGLVQDRAAAGRVPLGRRPLRRSGLHGRRPAADFAGRQATTGIGRATATSPPQRARFKRNSTRSTWSFRRGLSTTRTSGT